MAKKKDPKRVKAGKKAKTKGNNFEREVALALEGHYGDLDRPVTQRDFRRTPVSGGFREDYPGDLIVPDWFPLMPECKHSTRVRPAASYFNVFAEECRNWLIDVFLHAQVEAWNINKSAVVIFKDNSKPCMLLASQTLEWLHPTLHLGLTDPIIRVRLPDLDLAVLPLATFLKKINKEQLTETAARMKKEGCPDRHPRARS
jgi:hypothetical protein